MLIEGDVARGGVEAWLEAWNLQDPDVVRRGGEDAKRAAD